MTAPFPIMLFAAGLGTRMAPLTDRMPKPLIPVAGRTLLDHALALTDLPGIGPRVVNVHYRADMIRAHLTGRDVILSPEDPLLETGGGLRHALPLLGDGPVMTLNTDAIWRGPNPLAQLATAWAPEMEALLLLVPQNRVQGYSGAGDFVPDAAGRLTRGPGLIYTGAQILRTSTLQDVAADAFSLNLVWDAMIARGGLFGLVYPGRWCDVGRPASIPLAEALLAEPDDV
ncbi:MobA-like NTP transferase domain-containing protein [Loktanella fryxellensis]|uniref:MobA-like NTP transferase domain-containing protein n=1 Tax=Loktanella fryxellensis TaxID=245187 RepID=A0A1H8E0J9_9RHOB|nr:nucleotidyltransferase family protein [Loktanella fryxellensis]SEN12318.1 MobA-like NTP transferase domain-containing protein [Loktanella fryxellensis]